MHSICNSCLSSVCLQRSRPEKFSVAHDSYRSLVEFVKGRPCWLNSLQTSIFLVRTARFSSTSLKQHERGRASVAGPQRRHAAVLIQRSLFIRERGHRWGANNPVRCRERSATLGPRPRRAPRRPPRSPARSPVGPGGPPAWPLPLLTSTSSGPRPKGAQRPEASPKALQQVIYTSLPGAGEAGPPTRHHAPGQVRPAVGGGPRPSYPVAATQRPPALI